MLEIADRVIFLFFFHSTLELLDDNNIIDSKNGTVLFREGWYHHISVRTIFRRFIFYIYLNFELHIALTRFFKILLPACINFNYMK